MRIFVLAVAVLLFLAVLWGPALYLAQRCMAQGIYGTYGWLRRLLPAQLMVAIVLTVLADFIGHWDLGTLVSAITLAVSACGAASIGVLRLMRHRHVKRY